MWNWLWVILGLFFWFVGYFQSGFSKEDGSEISKAFVQPPFLIYLLCGLPRASNVPKGVIALRSLMAQLQGILFTTYGTTCDYLPINDLSNQVIVLSFAGFSILWLCWLMYKRFPYLANKP